MSKSDPDRNCPDCHYPIGRPFDNGDGIDRCEQCAVSKFKKDCPYTYFLNAPGGRQVFKTEGY